MKKRLFTLCLATLLFAGALTGILVSTSANTETEFDPDSYDYEALYVPGAVLHYSAMDHKTGDAVDSILDTSEGDVQLLLDKASASAATEWTYGDGYLDISTGSVIKANGVFAPADTENPEKGYTVEYLYTTLDKGLPQTVSSYASTYPQDAFYGAASVRSYEIAASAFATYYIKDEALAEMKALSDSYLACGDSIALQAGFTFEPNENHVGDDADGVFNYVQTQALINEYPKFYYFIGMDWTNVGNARVAKTVYNLGGTWKADYDWKADSKEIFRMPFGEMRQLNFLVTNTLGEDGLYTEKLDVYKDYVLLSSYGNTFTSEKLSDDLVLAKDVGTRIYAIRVYDRKLEMSEMQQNHVADICRAYRLDPSFYTEADEQDKKAYNSALSGVRIGVDSKEAVLESIEKAAASVLRTEKNVYTSLYVQEGLAFMVNPMATMVDFENGDIITTLSDLDGNFYPVGSAVKPATYVNRAVNLGLRQGVNFGDILPKEGQYTVRILYANSLADLPTADLSGQLENFRIGPASFRINYARPSVDPSAKGGVTKGYLYITNGTSGKSVWKNDFDTTWGTNKQPDLFAVDYGQITEFTNEITATPSKFTINIFSDGRSVATSSEGGGDLAPNALIIGSSTINKDFYAVMVYDCILTDEQKMQNHFADLMAYYQVDMTMFDRITNDNVKVKLYEALAEVKLGETNKEYLQGVLESFALTGGALGVIKAEDYITFEGIQARIEDYASARALFSFDNQKIAELEKLGCDVELGAILMPVTEDNTMDELTVAYVPSLGEYAPTSDGTIQKTVYRKGEIFDGLYGFATDAKRYFSATVPSLAPTADDTALNQQYYMRAYMAVDFDGSNFVLYSDAKSDLFGDSVSVMEACDYFLFTGYAESEILATLAGKYAAAAAKKTLEVSLLAHEKYDIADLASKLIASARNGAIEAKSQNNLASSGISIEMSQSGAMRVGPQAATTKVQAELYATIGIAKYEEALGAIAEARVAAQQMAADVYKEALAAGADEATATAVRETACARLLALIGDVETYLQTAEPLVAEMQSVLSAFADYKALLQLSKVFPSKASVFINKLPITRYTIVTDSAHLAIAENLQTLLLAHIGNTVGVYNVDNTYVGSHYDYTALNTIILGLTTNEVGTDGDSYAIYGDGNCIYLEGNTLEAVEAASAKFFKAYCGGTGRLQITLDRGANALLNQAYTPLISFNYGQSYPAVQCDSYDAEGVWQVFLQKMQQLPEEITVIDTVEIEDIPDSAKNVYYVATDGLDTNEGTVDAPLKTVEAALKKVAYTGGGTIYIRGGYYELAEPITVDSGHSGSLLAPLYISAYPGEEVIFTSAKQIEGSSLKTIDEAIANNLIDEKMKTRLNAFSADNSQNVYVTYLNPAIYSYGTPQTTQLYINGALSHVARWPNKGVEDPENYISNGRIKFTDKGIKGIDQNTEDVLKIGKVTTATSSLYDKAKNEVGGWEIVFDNCLYKDHILTYDKDVELFTYAAVFEEWHRAHYTLTLSVDDQGRNIMTSAENCQWGCMEKAGNNLYFYNAIEDLDENGEFYLDEKTGMLYIYSDTSLSDAEILLSTSDVTLLDVAGASNVVVNGLSFTKTMKTAVTVLNGDHVIIQNCTFSDIKGNALNVVNGEYCGVLNNDFSNTTSTMVQVSSSIEFMKSSYNFVQNNHFHDPNELVQAGLSIGGVGTVASHNLFDDTVVNYGSALETILEYNEFNRGSQITYDSGPIYLSGPSSKRANHVRYNYFHDLNISKYGIYLDDLSTGNYVYGNIIHYAEENSGGGKCVNLHSGSMNVIYNNIGMNAAEAGVRDNRNYFVKSIDGVPTNSGGLAYRWESISSGYVAKNVNMEQYAPRFPLSTWMSELAEQHIAERALNPNWSDEGDKNSVTDATEIFLRSTFYNVYLDNVMINCGNNGYAFMEYFDTRKEERNLYFAKPEEVGFVDYDGYDFNLRSDSAVWTQNPQFTELPFERMGRTVDIEK